MLRVTIRYPSVGIGVVTCGLSLLGIRLGTRRGRRFGKRAEVVGATIPNLIGLRIPAPHFCPG